MPSRAGTCSAVLGPITATVSPAADPRRTQRRGHRQRLVAQLRVAEVTGTGEHRGRVGLLLGLPEEPVVQGFSAGLGGAAVGRVAHRALRGRQRRRAWHLPGVVGGGQPEQFVDVVGEHRVDDARREDAVADVPIHQHSAVELGDLCVQQHLRALGDDPSGCAELLGDIGD